MADFYRVRIAAKRQVTLPQMMLDQLGLEEGDQLEFTVDEGAIRAVRPYRIVPLDFFPPEVRRMIAQRAKELESGQDTGYVPLVEEKDPASGYKYVVRRSDLGSADDDVTELSRKALDKSYTGGEEIAG